ncbi:class I SAM-dependent methyltransferase [Paenibacillus sp. Marseille-Q4541]|uniref:class I SAM-dependent methyltransferase n=1 Tax=Paenibacillus sp. Marseille-Q4541 TaxID=2831522 RepID=UPI001BAD79C7|nr:class I SAM-dependent methyltransferase [Paenibacillus sp. Marseille-Q4541]
MDNKLDIITKESNAIPNMEEYDNPTLYDAENEDFESDFAFIEKWATLMGGTVIDLACGTGRTTIPLAERGYPMVGVDLHEGMLDLARQKSAEEHSDIRWELQNCEDLELDIKSSLIFMVGNGFQHFLTNEAQDKLLHSVCKHLKESGIFIFNTRFPNKEELLAPETEEYWKTYMNKSGNEVDVYTKSIYDSMTQVQDYEIRRKTKRSDGTVEDVHHTNIKLRYTYPLEMERTLAKHGLKVIELYGDWEENPPSESKPELIYVCQKEKECN